MPDGTGTATLPEPRTLNDIVQRMEAIRSELRTYEINPPDGENDAQRTEREAFAETLLDEYDRLEALRGPLAQRMERLTRVLNTGSSTGDGNGNGAGNTEPGDGAGTPPPRRTEGYARRTNRDPFDNLEAVRSRLVPRGELRDRALDAIERANRFGTLAHDYAETATEYAQADPGVQRHILLTGSPEYEETFRSYLEDPQAIGMRAMLLTPGSAGGYLLPFVLDPTIILSNTGVANPWRRLARVERTTSNTWNGVTSAGISAAWLGENTEVGVSDAALANIAITPYKAAAWVMGSYEVLQDTDFGAQLPGLFADARDQHEAAAFAVGTGTAQPKGVITGSTVTVTAGGVQTYAMADLYNLQAALPARFRQSPSAAMVMSLPMINRTRQFDTAGGASVWTNLGAGQPQQVLGVDLYESTSMASTTTTGSKIAIYGDFRQFIIVDRVGVSMMYEPMIKGATGYPKGDAGWFMYWRVGSDISTNAAFRVLVTG
jgi:HK97 family phage major capsid protein